MKKKILPIGIDDFKQLIQGEYYYVDKTLLIKELIDQKGAVSLFTRPRRFGKTLNMSMLQCFFEKNEGQNENLFEGLAIMECGTGYLTHMGKYPVISISLKSMKQSGYEEAFFCFKEEIAREYKRHDRIVDSLKYESEKERYLRIVEMTATKEEYLTALRFLSDCLMSYYKQECVVLIDEYDVPLESSYFAGFYEKMISLIRSLFESVLKTNTNLKFAVITGCLRISKESIFTGLNNLENISILNEYYSEHFGFTQAEVNKMLSYYGIPEKEAVMREWYDGYRFGGTDVYNPWSAINYVKTCVRNADAYPEPYWSNTSSNSIVRKLIDCANLSVKQEIEMLIEGKTIEKPIHEDITYEDIDSTQDNLWNFLFFTGYLKKIEERMLDETKYVRMAIPNSEVRYIYKTTVRRWFEEQIKTKDMTGFYQAFLSGDAKLMEQEIAAKLRESISFYDNKEAFYHGFLLGLLGGMDDYLIDSNREAGDGRYDICLRSLDVTKPVILIELKVASDFYSMNAKSEEALKQIVQRRYKEAVLGEGYQNILNYGISFYKKNCYVSVNIESV